MKFFKDFMIYLLVSIGAVITLMPFGWMVSTSFKLPSEVNKWPPQWGSKNFLNKREIKVRVGAQTVGMSWEGIGIREALSMVGVPEVKENTLYMIVDDDPFYRGEVHILVTSEGDYSAGVPLKEVESLVERFKEIFKDDTRFESADDFFDHVFTEYAKRFDRISFVGEVSKILEGAKRSMKTLERFASKRIRDETEKDRFLEFLSNSIKMIDDSISKITVYRKGKGKILSDGEIEDIKNILENLMENLKVEDFKDRGAKALMGFFKKKVTSSMEGELEVLKLYFSIKKKFKEVQNERLKVKEIVARFRKKSERVQILVERLKNDDLLKPYSDILDSLISKKVDDLPERFLSELDSNMAEDLEKLGMEKEKAYSAVSEIRRMASTILSVCSDANLDCESLMKRSEDFRDFYRRIVSIIGETATLKVLKGKIEKISRNLKGDLLKIFESAVHETKVIARLRKIYDDSLSELEIVSAPDIVEAVRVKEGKSIEIALNVPPVYLKDESYRVAVFFSFGEVLANIFQNYVDAWNAAPFGRYYINTVFVATATTVLEVILASMAAFAFSILEFPGRDLLFGLFLMTMMVPGEVLLVPNFITITKFGWIDTYYALIVPWIVSVFAIFLIRQHFLTLPRELYDAAKIDGCSNWRYLWTIAVPLSKPVIITGALLKFVGSWNAFLWVLIVTNSEKYRTLPVGLHTFSSEAGTVYNQLMAAATFSILPVIILFLFMQKYFIRGIARTGLK